MPPQASRVRQRQRYQDALLGIPGCVGYWPLDDVAGATARNLFGSAIGTYTGAAATVTSGSNATDIVTNSGTNGFVAGVPIQFTALSGGAGITVGRTYYVISANLTTTTFQFSIAPGGAAFDFTSDIVSATVIQLFVTGYQGGLTRFGDAPAVTFNGVDQYISVPDSSAYTVATTGFLSIVLDAQVTAVDGATYIGKTAIANYEYDITQWLATPENIIGTIRAAAGTSIAAATTTNTALGWHHLVATMDYTNKHFYIYTDGALTATQDTWSGVNADGTAVLNFGRRHDGQYFNGGLRRIAFFNRILSPNDVRYLYGVAAGA